MNFQQFFKRQFVGLGVIAVLSVAVFAQAAQIVPMTRPSVDRPAAMGNNLYCAGFIQQSAISTGNRIIGGDQESETYNFDEGDFIYINMGANKGVNVGDTFSVVRPRGQVNSRWTSKNDIGFYVQEVGAVEVIRVKGEFSVAQVKTSCDSILLGDLVQLTEKRVSPMAQKGGELDLFPDPSGKARGRILMSRDGAEMVARDFIVYVDLGADDNVQVGDRLTVFRPLGKGNLFEFPQKESASARDYGFQSLVYRGGKFSNQAPRKSGDKADGERVTTSKAKEGRPALRKVVGEAVVLNVKERTATVLITRNSQEIHTGDWVEIK